MVNLVSDAGGERGLPLERGLPVVGRRRHQCDGHEAKAAGAAKTRRWITLHDGVTFTFFRQINVTQATVEAQPLF